MAPPVGPTGLRYCSGDDDARDFRAGLAGGYVETRLVFGAAEGSLVKEAVTVSLDRRIGERWTVGGSLGSTLAGSFRIGGTRFSLSPGPLAAFVTTLRAVDEGEVAPFVLFTSAVSTSLSWTAPPADDASQSMLALDVQVGVAAGKTIAHVLSPYALARAFGGPVFWRYQGSSVIGTDAYHYQVGGGLALRLGAFDVVAEGVPLGEKALVGGVGLAF